MSRKHQSPEYKRNALIIRKRVRTIHKYGDPVQCWRCGRAIVPGQHFDVGHLPNAQGSALHELAPEHRHRTLSCPGNRAEGGRVGAAATNARRTTPEGQVKSWRL